MSQSGHPSEGEKQNQGEPAHVEVPKKEELSPESKKLPESDESEKKQVSANAHMFPGSETCSIEGCEKGPCPCIGPDCNDGGGGGSRGYGMEDES